ncbi:MAG: acetoin utilization protein AcuC [Candidatus Hodarchaeota archaeon]
MVNSSHTPESGLPIGFLSLEPFVALSRTAIDHPFWNEKRFSIVYQLIKALNLYNSPKISLFEPREATDEELRLFHSEEYISTLKELSEEGLGWNAQFGFGTGDCPIFPKVHECSSMLVGGQLEIINALLRGEIQHGVALFGGLHHAHRSQASGFCYYNDPVISIKQALSQRPDWRVLYLDVDCHHGDGVQAAFYDSPQVLTVSFHESGHFLYPGTGFIDEIGEGTGSGYSINVPLPPYCDDSLYSEIFNEVIPSIFQLFQPDFIYLQAGTDTHFSDPITHLRLTNNLYRHTVTTIHELAHKHAEGRLFLAGGGGYNPDSTARAWALMTLILAEISPPEKIPRSWIDYCHEEWGEQVHEYLMDDHLSQELPTELQDYPDRVLKALKELAFSKIQKNIA